MSIEIFIKKIQEEIDEINLENLQPDTAFLEIEGWNSLYSLILMALVSTEYNIDLSGQQIKNIRTVQELYNAMNGAT